MQRLALEVVVRSVRLEDVEQPIRHQRKGKLALVVERAQASFQIALVFRADGHDRNAGFGEGLGHRREGVQLLDAMKAAGAEIEDHHDRPASIVFQGDRLAVGLGQPPRRRRRRMPPKGPQLVECGSIPDVRARRRRLAPVRRQVQGFDQRLQALKGRHIKIDPSGNGLQLTEGFLGVVEFLGAIKNFRVVREGQNFAFGGFDRFECQFAGSVRIARTQVKPGPAHRAQLGHLIEELPGFLGVVLQKGHVPLEFKARLFDGGEPLVDVLDRLGRFFFFFVLALGVFLLVRRLVVRFILLVDERFSCRTLLATQVPESRDLLL